MCVCVLCVCERCGCVCAVCDVGVCVKYRLIMAVQIIIMLYLTLMGPL